MARPGGGSLNPSSAPAPSLGLYLHIPFCQAICGYCNFNRGLMEAGLKTRYVGALAREIARAALPPAGRDAPPRAPAAELPADTTADTIFFGGGTPSLLDPAEVGTLIQACRDRFDVDPGAEITLETNPETATAERLAAFREAGVNRISFGVQSFDDAELRRLDRVHSADRAADAVRVARAAGFDNLSFDLMFWLPGQTRTSWRATVDRAVDLAPDHLSLYLLELYPNAPLKESLARAGSADPSWTQPPDDEAADMYLEALETLDAAGFRQYEISNVARPGYESRHNVKYWQEGAWVGFGCGAHSTAAGLRWRNIGPTLDYVDRISGGRPVTADARVLAADERVGEALFTGLRLSAGVDEGNFRSRHGVDPWSRHAEALERAQEAGLVWRADGRFGLTRAGMLVANEILVAFV